MKQKKFRSLSVNAFLNAAKSALSILFPLITYPYAFRILHTVGIGKVNYANSIISYFTLVAMLGISTYATREGAKYRDDPVKTQLFCNEVFSINIISTLIAYILLILFVFFFKPFEQYRELLMILSLNIAFTTLGVDWINTIYEDYLYTTIRSLISYVLTLILLFLIVRTEDDYLQYAFLQVLSGGIICFSNLFYCRKYVRIRPTKKLNLKKHIKPILTFFSNAVATTIYVSSDTTMLGYIAGDHYVGLYSLAVKVYNVIKTMLAAMYSVAIPRLSQYVGKHDFKSVRAVYTSIVSKLTIILLPAGIGLIAISREVVLIMGGREYLEAVPTLQILSVSLIGAIYGGALTYCLNLPLGREKYNAQATVLSAIINICLNLFMIPLFKQNGAAVTTAIAEFFVLIYCLYRSKDIFEFLDRKEWMLNLLHAASGCVEIIVITIIVKLIISNSLLRVFLIVFISVLFYFITLLLLGNKIAFDIKNKIKRKLLSLHH